LILIISGLVYNENKRKKKEMTHALVAYDISPIKEVSSSLRGEFSLKSHQVLTIKINKIPTWD